MAYIKEFMKSANHLVIISPRRFGKSSVVAKSVNESRRKHIIVNLQQVMSLTDNNPICSQVLFFSRRLGMVY